MKTSKAWRTWTTINIKTLAVMVKYIATILKFNGQFVINGQFLIFLYQGSYFV